MEFVDGERITEYIRRRNLSLVDKLKLFRDVCSAVQHAHQNLIVHRDLKPSNIMVTTSSNEKGGAPKLLDFGIAKLLAPDPGEAVTRTETAVRLMTPDYASPEQARGGLITTATDVYSLGVVLYELLTARRPYQFETSSPFEIDRAIWETQAPPPSEAASRQDGARSKLARQLAGDLDNIVMMALRREPERRYQSVEQFSEDIRRYLEGMPIVARKDTFRYRTGKLIRRHKAGVAILSLLVILAAVTAVQSVRIARERDRANQESAAAQAVTRSLVAMFEFADPAKARGNAITAMELLDQGAEKVVRELKDQPVVQAKLLDTIGQLYQSIGLYDREQPLLEEALKLLRQAQGNESSDVATILNHLGEVASLKGDYEKSESLYREALEMQLKLLGPENKDVAKSLGNLGELLVQRGKLGEAEGLLNNALTLRRKLFGEEHDEVANSLTNLGRLMSENGKFSEAESLYQQALKIRRKLHAGDHPLVAHGLNNLAAMLQEQGDFNGAKNLFRDALEMRVRLLGEQHPDVAVSMANLASALQDTGDYVESELLYRRTIALRIKLFGEEHPKLATTMNNLATLLRDKGNYKDAELLFWKALEIRRRKLGEDHQEVGTSLRNLGGGFYLKGEYDKAEKFQRQAIDVYQKSLKPDHWMIHRSRSSLGECLVRLRRYREAEEELLTAFAGLKAALDDRHAETRKAVSRLIDLYESWSKPDQAQPYRAMLQDKEQTSQP
jgi:serine/threonine-protein kinase